MKGKAKLVKILDSNGKKLYSRLIFTGDEVMRFESGHGFITKDQCKRNSWQIKDIYTKQLTRPGKPGQKEKHHEENHLHRNTEKMQGLQDSNSLRLEREATMPCMQREGQVKATHGGSRSGSGNKTGSKFSKTRKDKKGDKVGGIKCTPEQGNKIREYCKNEGLTYTELFINSAIGVIGWKQ